MLGGCGPEDDIEGVKGEAGALLQVGTWGRDAEVLGQKGGHREVGRGLGKDGG